MEPIKLTRAQRELLDELQHSSPKLTRRAGTNGWEAPTSRTWYSRAVLRLVELGLVETATIANGDEVAKLTEAGKLWRRRGGRS